MRFKDRVVIVTGGSRGIGRAISKSFAAEGAHVIVNYFSDEKAAQSLAEEVKSDGHSITVLKGDVGVRLILRLKVGKMLPKEIGPKLFPTIA